MQPGARLVVLGKQGAGKGTQCVRLSRHYVVPHIATGNIFRAAVKARTPLGREVQECLDAGDLVPDDVVVRMMAEHLEQDDARERGFILDGFPRNIAQANQLDELLHPIKLDGVINLVVSTPHVLRRLAGRRVCVDCATNYSVVVPPRVDWICDICGGEVIQRQDDTEAAIKHRLDLYEVQTAPLVERYQRVGKLMKVSGEGNLDRVTERLIQVVDRALAKRPEENA